MPNTIPAAGEAMPKTTADITDLEDAIENARRMASIASELVSDAVGGEHNLMPGKRDTYVLTSRQVNNMLFAAYQVEDILTVLRKQWEALS